MLERKVWCYHVEIYYWLSLRGGTFSVFELVSVCDPIRCFPVVMRERVEESESTYVIMATLKHY